MNTKQFTELFNNRHNFNSEDLAVLENKFPNIKFSNIPEAWIVLLDMMISDLYKYSRNIYEINQKNGYLDVKLEGLSKAVDIISRYSSKIYEIDLDLHQELRRKNELEN